MKIIYERNGETIGREIQSIRTSGKNSIKSDCSAQLKLAGSI